MMRKIDIIKGALSLSFVFLLFSSLSANDSSGRFSLIQARGSVNLSQIGGERLKVFSLWDTGAKALVADDGSFTTVISGQRPQKISLIDGRKMTRALSISLPQHSQDIVFDAASTASALLFYDASSFGQSAQVEDFCKQLQSKVSFQRLVSFLKKNLKSMSLEELAQDKEYSAILEDCGSEVFGQDMRKIKNSLQDAQKELQKALYEQAS